MLQAALPLINCLNTIDLPANLQVDREVVQPVDQLAGLPVEPPVDLPVDLPAGQAVGQLPDQQVDQATDQGIVLLVVTCDKILTLVFFTPQYHCPSRARVNELFSSDIKLGSK